MLHENIEFPLVAPVKISNSTVNIVRYIPLLHSAIQEDSTNIIRGLSSTAYLFPGLPMLAWSSRPFS